MTRRLAGLTGAVTAFSVGMILIFSLMVSSTSTLFSDLRFHLSEKETEITQEMTAEASESADESALTAPLSLPTELAADPSKISGLNKAAFSSVLYGSRIPTEKAEPVISTLTSLVLADHLPERDLGVFDITYEITPEEYEMLLFCVEFETRSGSVEHKALIAQVIMNRVQGKRFPSTVAEVLFAPNQFDVMPKWESRGEWTPSERTYEAVDLVLSGNCPDYAQGALYFCNPYIVGEGNWFDTSLTTICEIQGHRFYK